MRRGSWGVVFTVSAVLVTVAAAQLIPAVNEAACSPRTRVVSGLDTLFGEIHRAEAIAGDDSVMEFFSSRENGTWTLLRTKPDGRSCVVATGRGDWKQAEPAVRETSLEI